MAKTIVNIITEDNPIPAYLFIKEMYMEGDRLMYISAKDDVDDLMKLSSLIGVPSDKIDEIVLKNEMDEITYERIYQTVHKSLNKETSYWVNLAGGTRYMALAVQEVFNNFNSTFFYVQVEKNLIVQSIFNDSVNDNDDLFYQIGHRMNIAEYLNIHYIDHDLETPVHQPIRSEKDVMLFFKKFVQLDKNQNLNSRDFKVIELLRQNYRGRKEVKLNEISFNVPNLHAFFNKIAFKPEVDGLLNKQELDYLTGGWFEEYIYYLVEEIVKPQDIALNVTISRVGAEHTNELDVVFSKGNKLFVIECKTGVEKKGFNEIVYKACAIREALLGVSCHSYIFSLNEDTTHYLHRVANNMGITYVNRDYLTNPNELTLPFMQISLLANNEPLMKGKLI